MASDKGDGAQFHSKLEHLGERIRNMNTSGANRTGSPNLAGIGPRRARPGGLEGFSPRRTPVMVPGYPTDRLPDSSEIDKKYQEIMKLTGVLTIDGEKYKCHQNDLEQIGPLGQGTSGQVFKMRHKDSGKELAVKQMRRSGNKEENKRIIMDLETVLKSHSCRYIVHCYGIFISDEEVWICMELMDTCLDKLIQRLKTAIPENILGKIIVAVLRALNYLKEDHGVIHRDVKPSNILLDSHGSIKLCDFGISGRLVDSKAKTRNGTACAGYMAPERIEPPNPNNPDYDIRADVWSLGVTIVELARGEFPYKSCKNDFEVLSSVISMDPPVLNDEVFSIELRDFVRQCLTKDYKNRPKYKQLLEHPLIKKFEVNEVNVAKWYQSLSQTESSLSITNSQS